MYLPAAEPGRCRLRPHSRPGDHHQSRRAHLEVKRRNRLSRRDAGVPDTSPLLGGGAEADAFWVPLYDSLGGGKKKFSFLANAG